MHLLPIYYLAKPFIPRRMQLYLRRQRCRLIFSRHDMHWPIDASADQKPRGWPGWPKGKKFALVLTHDVETIRGMARVRQLAELEKRYGFRSCFNFVGKDYPVPRELLRDLAGEGFEIGIHGLHHNGLMYSTRRIFRRHAAGIQQCMQEWSARGFRSPSMHRELEWIHELGVDYDSSTFDTDPFEPQPHGVGTIFPFWILNRAGTSAFVELPYTLPQDLTLFGILRETSIGIWKRKLDWVAEKGGMSLLITHPDYLCLDGVRRGLEEYPYTHYSDFLDYIRNSYEGQYWAALPSEIAKYFSSVYPRPVHAKGRPLAVCMPTYSFYETDNRVRRYAETLAQAGNHVHVISLRRPGQAKEGILNGVHVYRIQERTKNEKGVLSYLWRTMQFLERSTWLLSSLERRHHYDFIHAHNIPDSEVFSAIVPKWRGAKIILDIHDIVPELFSSKFEESSDSLKIRLLLWIEKLSTRFADHVIVANDLWREKLIGRSVPREKCTTLLNYPDPAVFAPYSARRNGGREYILYPGTLNAHQGLDIALRAFAQIKDKVPQVDFHIYGEGPSLDSLKGLCVELGIEDRALFQDMVPTNQIAPIMASAKCGVVPKRADLFGNEAFSTKVLEFMALGVPIVLSNTAIDRYYFDPSLVLFFESGDYMNLAEKLLLTLTDEQLRKRMIENSLKFVKEYSWTSKQESYFEIIYSLTGKRPHIATTTRSAYSQSRA
jgi:glycosyltransferase involved in cell wall biosynthesis